MSRSFKKNQYTSWTRNFKSNEFMDRWDYADDGRVYSNSVAGQRWGVTSPRFFRK